MLSVVMCTARADPRWELIVPSLLENVERARAIVPEVELVAVDEGLWRDERACRDRLADLVRGRMPVQHVAPKPTVWRGPHRLTSQDHWDKPSALNTAVCHARHPRLAFFDDQSVLDPHWLASHVAPAASEALGPVSIAGTYRVWHPGARAEGCQVTGEPMTPGDHRLTESPGGGPCHPGWLYGGNVSFPLEALLMVNGWDEKLSGARGLEDCELSIRVSRVTKTFFRPDSVVNYLTFPDAGPIEPAARCKGFDFRDHQGQHHWMSWNHLPVWWLTDPGRTDQTRILPLGNSFDLRELRARVQAGGALPAAAGPTHDWRDGQPLSEM